MSHGYWKNGVGIRSIGVYLPDRVLTNFEMQNIVETTDEWIVSHIGVSERRIAESGQLSSDLGAMALIDAANKAGLDVRDIELVVSGCNTVDHLSPQTACKIIQKSGAVGAAGFDVRCGGCAGGVVALDVAAQYVSTGRYSLVAVVLAEVNSKIVNWSDRTTCVILGDGAACYLLQPCVKDKGILSTFLGNDPSGYYAAYVPAGGTAMPLTQDLIGSGMECFVMDGKAVLNFALDKVPQLFSNIAAQVGIVPSDADLLIMHQANKNIVQEVMKRLDLPLEKTYTNIERLGNTSSASVPLALAGAEVDGKLSGNDLILVVSFGAGFSYGAMAIRWCEPNDFCY